jgi:hypothetical protein
MDHTPTNFLRTLVLRTATDRKNSTLCGSDSSLCGSFVGLFFGRACDERPIKSHSQCRGSKLFDITALQRGCKQRRLRAGPFVLSPEPSEPPPPMASGGFLKQGFEPSRDSALLFNSSDEPERVAQGGTPALPNLAPRCMAFLSRNIHKTVSRRSRNAVVCFLRWT